MEKLVLIDGHSILNRAFYGVPELTNSEGLHTNAVYGFLNILFKILEEEKADHLAVAFDLKAPTFRHEMYGDYKGTRKPMPEELHEQVPVMKEVLAAMEIPILTREGYEADDILGTAAKKAQAMGIEVSIVSGDRDLLQLADTHIKIRIPKTSRGTTEIHDYYPEDVKREYQVTPAEFIDVKALMGDASDNIPGVPSIGEKTATNLIVQYHSLENIYAHLDEVKPPRAKKALEEHKDMAELSRTLAKICIDAPIDFSPEQNLRRGADNDALYQLFLDLEFAKLIDKYGLTAPQGEKKNAGETFDCSCVSERVDSRERMEELLDLWRERDWVSVLALPSLDVVCVAWEEPEGERRAALFFADQWNCHNDFLRILFSDGRIRKAVHGLKSLWRTLLAEGIVPGGFGFDTEVAAYLLAPTDGSYDLEKLGLAYFNFQPPRAADYLDEGAFGPLSDPAVPTAALTVHAVLIGALRTALTSRLEELELWELYQQIELPLCSVLAEMEGEGVLVDRGALVQFGEMLSERIGQVQARIYDLAGEDTFNINSTQQLGQVLFERLGLPPVKKTKTGWSTNAEVLEKLRGQHPIIEEILEYRQLTKLKSTYADGLGKVIAPDGRIHTSFQNTVTATGRLSSTEPNLQNIPVRTELGAELRKMFVAPAGKVLVDADYSQIELRLLAHIAGDKAMIDGFRSGEDIHTITAAQVFGVARSEVTPLMRRSAKAVNFGIVYGISPFSLSQDIGVTVAEAKEYMDKYFAHYAGVRAYMDAVVEQAREQGFVSTLYGRRRWVPELKSSNFNTRSFGERVALNAPIQGTAADIIKLAMIRVRDRLKAEGLEGRLVLQVHDELIVECPESEAETVCKLVEEEMEGVAALSVPLLAETHAGRSWAESH